MNLYKQSGTTSRSVEQECHFTSRVTNCLGQAVECRQRHNDQTSTVLHLSIANKGIILQTPQMHICEPVYNKLYRVEQKKLIFCFRKHMTANNKKDSCTQKCCKLEKECTDLHNKMCFTATVSLTSQQ